MRRAGAGGECRAAPVRGLRRAARAPAGLPRSGRAVGRGAARGAGMGLPVPVLPRPRERRPVQAADPPRAAAVAAVPGAAACARARGRPAPTEPRRVSQAAGTAQRRIAVCEPYLGGREAEDVLDCLKTNRISSAGTYLTEFERAFARYCGAAEGVGTTSGTTALHVALAARGLGPGDEIIMPAFTIAATVFAALYVGATPVLVDVEPDTWTLRVDQVAARIGPRTRAVIPVHVYGHPCDMDPLTELARRHGLWLVEDAAEVHGAEDRGEKCGGLGGAGGLEL